MATLIVKHRVADFDTWKKAFDSMTGLRAEHGWTSHLVLRDPADPNHVTIVNRVRSAADAKRYGGAPELKAAMEMGGVIGPPDIALWDDADERVY